MNKVLIVEDEMIIAANISMMLENLGYEITGIIPRGEDALKSIESTRPDLVLMDIALKGKLDGIKTARIIMESHEIPVIFLTANSDEATFEKAKLVKPKAFISKPFRQSDLHHAIQLAIESILEEKVEAGLLPNSNEDEESYILADRIFIRQKDRMVKIFISDILYVEADRSYCKIFTQESEFLLTMPLRSFEEKLDSNNLLRVHRSYLINIHKIDAVSSQFGYVTIGKKTISVSKSFQESLAHRVQVI